MKAGNTGIINEKNYRMYQLKIAYIGNIFLTDLFDLAVDFDIEYQDFATRSVKVKDE